MQVVATVRIWTLDEEDIADVRERLRKALRTMGNDFRIEHMDVEATPIIPELDKDEVLAYLESLQRFWGSDKDVAEAARELHEGEPMRLEDFYEYRRQQVTR